MRALVTRALIMSNLSIAKLETLANILRTAESTLCIWISKCIFLKENVDILIVFLLKFATDGLTHHTPWKNACWSYFFPGLALQWCHNERDGVSNHQHLDCLLNRLFRHRPKITSKLRVTGFYEGNPLMTGVFPSQRASNAENVSIWWRHYGLWHGTERAVDHFPVCCCIDVSTGTLLRTQINLNSGMDK